MRQACPESSRYLLEQVFPRLRHTDYLIDYTLRSMTERQGLVLVDIVRRLPIDSISLPVEPINSRFNTFRPIVAVKTNMLYDLLLAPNIEVEVPFGRQLQWSIMGEYWNPWYRWHRKDYSYEIQGG